MSAEFEKWYTLHISWEPSEDDSYKECWEAGYAQGQRDLIKGEEEREALKEEDKV